MCISSFLPKNLRNAILSQSYVRKSKLQREKSQAIIRNFSKSVDIFREKWYDFYAELSQFFGKSGG